MSKIYVLAVLPYKELLDMVERVSLNYPELSVDCHVGNLEEGVSIAKKEMENKNYDVILSRGGTAELLRKEIQNSSIFEIPISFEDIFYTVMLGKNYCERFAVVSFPALTSQVNSLCAMLNYDVEIRSICSEMDAYIQLENLQSQGYTMIIGDVITAQTAKELGLNVVLITSNKNSVNEILQQICNLRPIFHKNRRQNKYMDYAQETAPCKLTILNEQREIVFSDFTSENCEKEEFLDSLISNYNNLMEGNEKNHYLEIEGILFYLKMQEHEIEMEHMTYIYSMELFHIKKEDSKKISIFTKTNDIDFSFQSPFGVTNSIGSAKEQIIECSKTGSPVLILGETGTGKDAAAKSIYLRNKEYRKSFFTIDCALTNDKEWVKIFNKNTSPLYYVDGTIYFKNIHCLTKNRISYLMEQLEHSNLFKRNKLIFSETTQPGKEVSIFSKYILENISCFMLHLLPVRERKDDLQSMLVIYLNELNLEYGKRIVGFTEEAKEVFINYPWPGNIAQLKRVLRELVNAEQGLYITRENVEKHLKNEMFQMESAPIYNINLDQTLEEINQDIVHIIMKQENMNQSRAAQRLNIGRSTLWRMLKKTEGRKSGKLE